MRLFFAKILILRPNCLKHKYLKLFVAPLATILLIATLCCELARRKRIL